MGGADVGNADGSVHPRGIAATIFHAGVVSFTSQPAHQTEVGRYPSGSGESDGCVPLRGTMGADGDGQKPNRLGSGEELHQTAEAASGANGGGILQTSAVSPRALSNDGDHRTVPRFARKRDCRTAME